MVLAFQAPPRGAGIPSALSCEAIARADIPLAYAAKIRRSFPAVRNNFLQRKHAAEAGPFRDDPHQLSLRTLSKNVLNQSRSTN
jgi:hypothetical protein